jgi:hypothetical protein
VYLSAGAGVVAFTVLGGLVPAGRMGQMFLLRSGIGFVIVFGLLIMLSPELWRWRWTVAPTRWLLRLLTVTNSGRALLFLLNAFGLNVHAFSRTGPAFFVVHTDANPLFLVNVALMACVTFMLARAGWAHE